ncbi:hypothetical protein QJQ45_017307 [Haematococcus lacustris]|nr:hypothetical protein QJQ45_017307 [Haematococcus lacustris]
MWLHVTLLNFAIAMRRDKPPFPMAKSRSQSQSLISRFGRYNRLTEYWKVPRDYKTFYLNILNVAGWDGEQAFKKNFHLPRW